MMRMLLMLTVAFFVSSGENVAGAGGVSVMVHLEC
jgi:hypothetical protein